MVGRDEEARDEEREREALLRFVEQFALVMTEGGIPRMPARVFAYVLADDATVYTAKELSQGLGVSPAAISGAVRYLVQSGLLIKRREPGSRSDQYGIDDEDVWSTVFAQRVPLIERWDEQLTRGVRLLGTGRRGGQRLLETQAYVRFLHEMFTHMQEEWPRRRPELVAQIEKEHRAHG